MRLTALKGSRLAVVGLMTAVGLPLPRAVGLPQLTFGQLSARRCPGLGPLPVVGLPQLAFGPLLARRCPVFGPLPVVGLPQLTFEPLSARRCLGRTNKGKSRSPNTVYLFSVFKQKR